MTDEELAEYLHVDIEAASRISPARRAAFEKLRKIEEWDRRGRHEPVPRGVLVDLARIDKRGRTRL